MFHTLYRSLQSMVLQTISVGIRDNLIVLFCVFTTWSSEVLEQTPVVLVVLEQKVQGCLPYSWLCTCFLEVILLPSLGISPTYPQLFYKHLRIELLSRGSGGVGPWHVVVRGHVAITVNSVPAVAAGAPGQGGLKWWQQVVQSPGHDGIVVKSYVEGYDADGKAYPWMNEKKMLLTQIQSVKTQQILNHVTELCAALQAWFCSTWGPSLIPQTIIFNLVQVVTG